MTTRPVPSVGKPEYRVLFYHQHTGAIIKYKFSSSRSANDFFDRLDPVVSKPTMYKITRIR